MPNCLIGTVAEHKVALNLDTAGLDLRCHEMITVAEECKQLDSSRNLLGHICCSANYSLVVDQIIFLNIRHSPIELYYEFCEVLQGKIFNPKQSGYCSRRATGEPAKRWLL
jgi:hypothetical protein